MIRNFKALGLALVALLALGAMVASSASAAGEKWHSDKPITVVTGEDETGTNDTFSTSGFTIECETSKYAGTVTGDNGTTTATTVTVFPTYTNCTSNLGNSPVDTTGCVYEFDSETNASKDLPVKLTCTTGEFLKITAPGCTLYFGSQTTGGGVVAKNEGSPGDVTITATATVAVTKKEGFSCFAIGNSGLYSGKDTVKGFEDKGLISGTYDNHPVYSDTTQINISWF